VTHTFANIRVSSAIGNSMAVISSFVRDLDVSTQCSELNTKATHLIQDLT